MQAPQHSIGKENAIKLFESNWWEGKSHREIAEFQLFTSELCVPFEIFHEALEKTLGRPVWTHELALNYSELVKEIRGEIEPPTMQDIINLIPEDKRILITV